MRRLRADYPDTLVIVGVHAAKFTAERQTANIAEAVRRHDIRHPVVNDADFAIWQSYAVRAWPTVVIVDARGRIAHVASGEIDADAVAARIDALIAEAERAGDLDRRPVEAIGDDVAAAAAGRPASHRALAYPSKLLVVGDHLWLADTAHHRLIELRLSPDRRRAAAVRVIGCGRPGLVDGPAEAAAFHDPRGLTLHRASLPAAASGGDRAGVLYVADTENHAVRAVDLASGAVRTVAGTGAKGEFSSGGPPRATALRSPWAVLALESAVLIAMAGSHQLWVLIDEAALGPFAGNGREALVDGPRAEASFNQPSDLTRLGHHIIVADAEASAIRAVRLSGEPEVFTLVGQGLFEWGDVDGPSDTARLQHPLGVCSDGRSIFIADSYNHKIKRLDPTTGVTTTVVGRGRAGHRDGASVDAELFEPEGVSVDGHLLYIADTNNHAVRVADLAAGEVWTLDIDGLAAPTL